MASISYINHYFRAPSLLKPLESRPQGQNLTVPTYSSFVAPGTSFSPVLSPKLPFFDQCFLYFAILGPLKPYFDHLDR